MEQLTRRTALKGALGGALALALAPLLQSAPASAAVTNRVRLTTGSAYGSPITALPMTFPAPTAGNLLLAVVGVQGSAGTFRVPSDWKVAFRRSGTSVSLAAMYRLASGSESSTTLRWSTASLGGSWIVAEYTGISTTDPLGPLHVPAYTDAARTSMPLNPATAEANSIALALFAIDSMDPKSSGDTGGGEFRPTSPGWNWIATGYHSSQGDCPGTALTEYGTALLAGEDLSRTTFAWARSDQVIGAVLQLNTGGGKPALVSRWVGAVTVGGATVAVKASTATTLRLVVASDPALTANVVHSAPTPSDANGMAKLSIDGLTAGTQYYYGVEVDGMVDTARTGSFRTSAEGAGDLTFAFASCCRSPDASTFSEIRGHDPDLFIHLGDLHYGNIGVNDAAPFRDRYDTALASAHQGPLYANVPTVYTWSDHDFGAGDVSANSTSPSKPAAQATYRQYVPSYPLPSPSGGIYQTFVHRRIRFVVTDNRSYKTPKSAVDDANKTVLGVEQKQWFKDTISTATEPVIVWVNELPWIGPASTGSDRWAGYTTERAELAAHIAASGQRVVIISGDMHALAADDGSNSAGGVPVFHAAPIYGASSHKGGPYTHGPHPTTAGTTVQQYGLMRVVDTGTTIALEFTGYEVGRIARSSYTKTYTI